MIRSGFKKSIITRISEECTFNNCQSCTIFPLLHNCSTRGNANIWFLFWILSCFLRLKNVVFLPGFIFDFPVNVWFHSLRCSRPTHSSKPYTEGLERLRRRLWFQKFVPSLKWHFWFQMLTEYRANGTEEAKKKRRKPGMQSTGGLDISAPLPPPPPPRYCISLKDFCPVGNEKSLFVILLSNLNG